MDFKSFFDIPPGSDGMIEVEARLVLNDKTTNIGKYLWYKVLDFMNKNTEYKGSFEKTHVTRYNDGIRKIQYINRIAPVLIEKKTKLTTATTLLQSYINDDSYKFRLNKSEEVRLRALPPKSVIDSSLYKTRMSYLHKDTTHRVDLTCTESDKGLEYTVEVEYLSYYSKYKFIIEKLMSVITDKSNSITKEEHDRIKKLCTFRPINAINIKTNVLKSINENYAVTAKLNGSRRFLIFSNGIVYTSSAGFNPTYSKTDITYNIASINNTVFETEYFKDKYYIYDIVKHNGTTLAISLDDRVELINSLVNLLGNNKNIVVKQHLVPTSNKSLSDLAYNLIQKLKSNKEDNDGIIFTQLNTSYSLSNIYKWKWEDELTIDLLAVYNYENSDVKDINLYINNTEDLLYVNSEFNGTIPYNKEIPNNTICEFGWNYTISMFEFRRVRHDKVVSNRKDTVEDVWDDIMEPISDELLKSLLTVKEVREDKDSIRVNHNKVKESLINTLDIRGKVLDIGFGAGGDYNKYNNAGVRSVIGIEPSEENIKKANSRNYNGRTKVKLFKLRAEDTNNVYKNVQSVSSGVSFFSLTFFFKNIETLTGLINTIDKCVTDTFIGTTLDGSLLYDDMENVQEKSWGNITVKKEYGNSEFGIGLPIIFNYTDSVSVFNDQAEYLVDFKLFTSLMEKIGFILTETNTIAPAADDQINSFSLLNRSFIFKRSKVSVNYVLKSSLVFIDAFKKIMTTINNGYKGSKPTIESYLYSKTPDPFLIESIKSAYLSRDPDAKIIFPLSKTPEIIYNKLTSSELTRSEKINRDTDKIVNEVVEAVLVNYEKRVNSGVVTKEMLQYHSINNKINIAILDDKNSVIYDINTNSAYKYIVLVENGDKYRSMIPRVEIENNKVKIIDDVYIKIPTFD